MLLDAGHRTHRILQASGRHRGEQPTSRRRRRLASGRPTVKDEKSTGRSAALTIILGFTLVACVCVTNELKIRTIGRLQLGGLMSGFRKFLLRGNLVDLAVAVVIGVAFNAVIQALISDLITPIISALGGKPDFGTLSFTVNHSKFAYGAFINALLSFVIIALVVYFLWWWCLVMKAMTRGRPEQGSDGAGMPGVPEQDPDRRPPVHVLHRNPSCLPARPRLRVPAS